MKRRTSIVLVVMLLGLAGVFGCGEKSRGEKLADRRAEILRRGNELEESVRKFGLENPEFSVDTVERVSFDIGAIARMGVEISSREQRGALSPDEVAAARKRLTGLQKAALEMTQLRALRGELRLLDEQIAAASHEAR